MTGNWYEDPETEEFDPIVTDTVEQVTPEPVPVWVTEADDLEDDEPEPEPVQLETGEFFVARDTGKTLGEGNDLTAAWREHKRKTQEAAAASDEE